MDSLSLGHEGKNDIVDAETLKFVLWNHIRPGAAEAADTQWILLADHGSDSRCSRPRVLTLSWLGSKASLLRPIYSRRDELQ